MPNRTENAELAGLEVCWVPVPGNPARNCTLKDGHDGPHLHEYSGTRWDGRE